MVETHYRPTAGGESSGRTAQAVTAQLAAMDGEQYELGVYDSATRQMTIDVGDAMLDQDPLACQRHHSADCRGNMNK
jgi:hypothetical protein